MEEIANEGKSIQFIDVDQSQDLASEYRVTSVPTVVIEENGQVVDRFIGVIPKQQVLQKLL
tara:strand:- start:534 stop:716 length:183 start_codon:yes stop_codon:yes gene_type:complete